MKNYKTTSQFTSTVYVFLTLIFILIMSACASTPESETTSADTGEASAAVTDAPATESSDTAQSASDTTSSSNNVAAASAPATPAVEPEEVKPPRIVESCKDEPYIKYEQQARESITKGLAATKAAKFGVGFRNVEEHNKWSKIHNTLFKNVNDACDALSQCAKTHKKDKDTECVAQAKTFSEWQALAKRFAEQAKTAETTQPPKICSQDPNLADPARCFHSLADNVDKACDGDECKEVSDCWRGVGFLDQAIIQAEQACGFVHQKLSNCRGYTEATNRRKKKFEQCKEMQGRLNITVFPVL